MKKAISLFKLSSILENETSKAQDRLRNYLSGRYLTILSKLCKDFSLVLDEASKMLFYPNYALKISLEFKAYKIGDKTIFSSKKPNFFTRIFKKVSSHHIKISHHNIFIDDVILDKKQAKEIKINI